MNYRNGEGARVEGREWMVGASNRKKKRGEGEWKTKKKEGQNVGGGEKVRERTMHRGKIIRAGGEQATERSIGTVGVTLREGAVLGWLLPFLG